MSSIVLSDYLKRQMEWMSEAIDDITDSNLPEEIKEQMICEYIAKWKAYAELRNFIFTYYMEEDNEKNTNRPEH